MGRAGEQPPKMAPMEDKEAPKPDYSHVVPQLPLRSPPSGEGSRLTHPVLSRFQH